MKTPYVSELEPNQLILGVFLVQHKEIRQKSLKNHTSGAEALSDRIFYGTAEGVPFVQRLFRSPARL